MSFFDEEYINLPRDGQYYFNVLVICIGITPIQAPKFLGEGVEEITYIEQINGPRPRALFFFIDETLTDDIDYQIEQFPHCVVEVSQQCGVSWYEMLDFDTEDPWRIE